MHPPPPEEAVSVLKNVLRALYDIARIEMVWGGLVQVWVFWVFQWTARRLC